MTKKKKRRKNQFAVGCVFRYDKMTITPNLSHLYVYNHTLTFYGTIKEPLQGR